MATTIEQGKGSLPEANIAAAESALGVSFPDDYRSFMARFNGGRPKPRKLKVEWRDNQACADEWPTTSMGWFYWISDDPVNDLVDLNKTDFAGRLPNGCVTIAADAGGNQVLLALAGPHSGKVLFWVKDHEVDEGDEPGYDNVGFLADSFAELLTQKLY